MNQAKQSASSIVVVGVDYSDVSAHALSKALDYANERGAQIHVVHVLDHGEKPPNGRSPSTEDAERLRTFVNAELGSRVHGKPFHLAAIGTHLVVGRAANELVAFATDLGAEVLIVGTHGRHGVERILLGSVAERVVGLSTIPVMVVPAKEAKQQVVRIEPACSDCLSTRAASGGKELWCEQHRIRHGRRHTYHYRDLNSEAHASDSLLINI